MNKFCIVLFVALVANHAHAQLFVNQPIAYQLASAHQAYQPYQFAAAQPSAAVIAPPHRAVEINAAHESLLPPELLKSKRFYDNPRIAEALAKESWYANKEMPVRHREAEKIPRDQIYKLAKNAGFVRRR